MMNPLLAFPTDMLVRVHVVGLMAAADHCPLTVDHLAQIEAEVRRRDDLPHGATPVGGVTPFENVVLAGLVDNSHAFTTIRFDGSRLSVTSVIGATPNGNATRPAAFRVSADECAPCAGSLTARQVAQLQAVGDRWHLNDLRLGSPEQERHLAGWFAFMGVDPSTVTHSWRRTILASAGLLVDSDGYRYGTLWRVERVPVVVLVWLAMLPWVESHPWGEVPRFPKEI